MMAPRLSAAGILDVPPGMTEPEAVAKAARVIPGLGREEYDRLQRENFSRLKHIEQSPAHYRHHLLARADDTPARKRGRVTHSACLEPHAFAVSVAVWDGGTRRGKEWDRFVAEHRGQELLTADEHEQCLAIQSAVRAHPVAGSLLTGGQAELTVTWTHVAESIGGLPGYSTDLKGRLDYVTPTCVCDLKTTTDASPEAFGRSVHAYRSHAQAAMYLDGYEAATGKRLPYLLVAVETEAPYAVAVYEPPESVLAVGRDLYRGWLDRLAACRREDRWPGYPEQVTPLMLPRWAMPRDEEDDVSEMGLVIGGAP